MRQALIKYNNILAGRLTELDTGEYEFAYDESFIQNHADLFITFQMPVSARPSRSKRLFPFFDGLIPEGWLLTIAAESWRINKNDRMGLLLACCQNIIGAVSVHPLAASRDVASLPANCRTLFLCHQPEPIEILSTNHRQIERPELSRRGEISPRYEAVLYADD